MKVYPYGRQQLTREDIESAVDVLKSDYITQGPRIAEFESEFAAKTGARYAVAYNSGTSALHGAYFALGETAGSEFITSPNTFVATGNAGLYLGLKPVFCDVEPDTGNIDTEKIENLITPRTRFIVPVHFAGHPSNLSDIQDIATRHNLRVIEDAAHATGAEYRGMKIGCGEHSEMAIFSFHPVKHIATGEGGMVVTNDEGYYKRLMDFRTHGIRRDPLENSDEGPWYYEMHHLGYNYRITDIQAALGLSQLKRIEKNIERRRRIAELYGELLADNPWFDLPVERAYAKSAYHLYAIRLKDHLIPVKKRLFTELREAGLWVQTHYIPVPGQPYYRKLGYSEKETPNAVKYYRSEISIPMYHALTDDDVKEVTKRLVSVFRKNTKR
jgi:UDP-4-amino-4,6-dideoxy-N-acetyl-beta-L-altrosamine transaminase